MANILEVIINGDAKGLNKSLSSASSKLKAFGRQTTDIGKRLSTRLTLPIGLAGAAAVKSASDFEKLQTSLNVLTGGAEQGAKAFERLVKFSAKTPFQLGDLAAVNNQLIGFGMSTDDAFNSLKLLGDVSAVAGADLTRVAVAFGQSAAAGRVMQQDINQFINNGIPIYKILNGVTGASVDQLRKMGSEGKITFDLLKQGFIKATSEGGQFENGMEKLSQTFAGQFSTLKDNLNIALAKFGKILLPILKNLLADLTSLIQRFAQLSPKIKESILKFAGLAAILPPLLIVIGSIATAIGSISAPIAIAIIAISSLIVYFDDIVEAGERLRDFLQKKLNVFLIKAKEKFELLGGQVNRLGSIFREVLSKGFSADIDSINKKFNEQSKAIKEATKNELKLLNTKKENKKETEKETKAIAQNNKEQEKSNNTIKQTRKEVESVMEFSGKRLVSLFDPSKKAAFGFNFEKIKTDFDGLKKQSKSLKEGFTVDFGQIGATIAQTFGQALVSGGNVFQNLGKTILSIIGDLIIQMGTAAIAASKLAKTFAIPVVGAAAGIAAIALGTVIKGIASKMQSGGVTAFANGGIVSAPTLGLMGEYPGARSNPEVIAPLDKLKSMVGGGQTNVNITGGFKLEGQDLVLALQRADRNRTRIL